MTANPTRQDLFDAAFAIRKQVLGDAYVDRAFAVDDEFNADMQQYLTVHAWGASWARRTPEGEPALPFKTRSMLNLAMISALNRPHELEIHVRGAINNGVTVEEIKEVLLHATVYCGIPAGLDAFKAANEVLTEMKAFD